MISSVALQDTRNSCTNELTHILPMALLLAAKRWRAPSLSPVACHRQQILIYKLLWKDGEDDIAALRAGAPNFPAKAPAAIALT